MSSNPFASFNIEIPTKYREAVIKYCRTGGKDKENTPEFSPFERQVDMWFTAFLIAVNKELDPMKETDTYKATDATILSTDQKRVSYLQLAVLGLTNDFSIISKDREVFEYCLGLANAGFPYLIQALDDPDERPLWSVLDLMESLSNND